MSSGVFYRETVTAEWTDFVAMTGFWVTGILLIFYLLHVIEKFHVIPWMMIEMGFTILWAFFYFTCSIDLAVKAAHNNGLAAFAGECKNIKFSICLIKIYPILGESKIFLRPKNLFDSLQTSNIC